MYLINKSILAMEKPAPTVQQSSEAGRRIKNFEFSKNEQLCLFFPLLLSLLHLVCLLHFLCIFWWHWVVLVVVSFCGVFVHVWGLFCLLVFVLLFLRNKYSPGYYTACLTTVLVSSTWQPTVSSHDLGKQESSLLTFLLNCMLSVCVRVD